MFPHFTTGSAAIASAKSSARGVVRINRPPTWPNRQRLGGKRLVVVVGIAYALREVQLRFGNEPLGLGIDCHVCPLQCRGTTVVCRRGPKLECNLSSLVIERSKTLFLHRQKTIQFWKPRVLKLYILNRSRHTLDTDGFERAIPRVVKGQTMHSPAQEALAKDSSLMREQSVPE